MRCAACRGREADRRAVPFARASSKQPDPRQDARQVASVWEQQTCFDIAEAESRAIGTPQCMA